MDLRKFDQFWFALQVRPRCEDLAAAILCGKGYEQYLPVHSSPLRTSRLRTCGITPLFPGYLFCRFSASANGPIVTTPGVIRIVSQGKTAVPISDEEIATIRAIERSDQIVHPFPYLKIGDRVRVNRGPLAGVEGLLVNIRTNYRLVVSIDLLCRSIAVEIEAHWIDPIPGSSPLSSLTVERRSLGKPAA